MRSIAVRSRARDAARAQVAVAEAELASYKSDLAKAEIRSPTNGIVLSRDVDPGQTVAASLQAPILFTIAEDLAKMQLLVDVDEADAGSVHEGEDATFTVEAFPDRDFAAHVEQLRYAPQTVSGVVTYKAVLSVDNRALLLRPGMTATAKIVVDHVANALLVPNAALRFAPETAQAESSGGFLSGLVPRPPKATPADKSAGAERQVWTLKDGTPQAIAVKTGATDGVSTVVAVG